MFFNKFPFVTHNNQQIRNITLRCKLNEDLKIEQSQLLPYTLQYNDRPDSLSYDYYGVVDFYWLVMYANNVYDPYNDWYQSDEVLNENLKKKYGTIENAMETVVHYNIDSNPAYDDIVVSEDTIEFNNMLNETLVNPRAVYAYDIAQEENAAKQEVLLVNRDLSMNLSSELERLLNNRE